MTKREKILLGIIAVLSVGVLYLSNTIDYQNDGFRASIGFTYNQE